jgi:hypothetical protein
MFERRAQLNSSCAQTQTWKSCMISTLYKLKMHIYMSTSPARTGGADSASSTWTPSTPRSLSLACMCFERFLPACIHVTRTQPHTCMLETCIRCVLYVQKSLRVTKLLDTYVHVCVCICMYVFIVCSKYEYTDEDGCCVHACRYVSWTHQKYLDE